MDSCGLVPLTISGYGVVLTYICFKEEASQVWSCISFSLDMATNTTKTKDEDLFCQRAGVVGACNIASNIAHNITIRLPLAN